MIIKRSLCCPPRFVDNNFIITDFPRKRLLSGEISFSYLLVYALVFVVVAEIRAVAARHKARKLVFVKRHRAYVFVKLFVIIVKLAYIA